MTMNDSEAKSKSLGVEFGLGALAATGAGIFTNPIDVIKIRLQLQGELAAKGTYKKLYKNTFHAGYMIAKYEGILSLQSALGSALAFQVVLNGIRIGSFKFARTQGWIVDGDGQTNVPKTALMSGVFGYIAGILASPFYLVKTQIQSQSVESIAVGHQHNHKNQLSAYAKLWNEGGILGLYQRCTAGGARLFVGSATQLTSFSFARDWLQQFQVFDSRPMVLTFCSSVVGGIMVALAVQPVDVISSRLYNQAPDVNGKLVYRGITDAFIKILKTEGFTGLYKGVFPTMIRIAPHTVLCLCFYDQLEIYYDRFIN